MSFKSAAVKGRITNLAKEYQAASGFNRAGIAATMRRLNDSLGTDGFDAPTLNRMLGRMPAPPETLLERFTRKVEQEIVDPGVAFEQELAYVKTLEGDAKKAAFGELGQLLNRRDVKRALGGDKTREYEAEIAAALGQPEHEANVELAEQVRLVLENTKVSIANRFEDAFTIAMRDKGKDEQKAAFQKLAEFVVANINDQVFVAWAAGNVQNKGLVRTVFERAELEMPANVKQKLGMEEPAPAPVVPQIVAKPQRQRRWGAIAVVVGSVALGAAFLVANYTDRITKLFESKPAAVAAPEPIAAAPAPQFNVGGQTQTTDVEKPAATPVPEPAPAATSGVQIGTNRVEEIKALAGKPAPPRGNVTIPNRRTTIEGLGGEERKAEPPRPVAATLNTAEGVRRLNTLLDRYSGEEISMSADDKIAVTVVVGAAAAQDSVIFTAGSVNTGAGHSVRTVQSALVEAAVDGLGGRPTSGTATLKGSWSL